MLSTETDIMQYIYKMEKVLTFLNTFDTSKCNTLSYPINEKFEIRISSSEFKQQWIEIFRPDVTDNGNSLDTRDGLGYHVIKTYPSGLRNIEVMSYYNDDFYNEFIFHESKNSSSLRTTVAHEMKDEIIELAQYDLSTEEGRFQLSLVYSLQVVNILSIHQYFYNKQVQPFSCWFHSEFNELYEVLDDKYKFRISTEANGTNT
jgi:hypothetical protein